MADINIEKDKNNNSSKVWLWVIGLLVLAGIIWWIAAGTDDAEVYEEAEVVEQRISHRYNSQPLGEDIFSLNRVKTA